MAQILASTLDDCRRAIERARSAYHWQEAIACYDSALALPGIPTKLEIAWREGRAYCNERLGRYRSAMADLDIVARLVEETGDVDCALETMARRAELLSQCGELVQSELLASNLLQRAHTLQRPYFAARAHYASSLRLLKTGEYEAATQAALAAQRLFIEQGALRDEALASYQIAFCASYTGQESEPEARRVMAIARQLDDRLLLAQAHHVLGVAYQEAQPSRARGYHEKALEIYEEIGEIRAIAAVTHNIGCFYYDNGLYRRAYTLFQKALAIWDTVEAQGSGLLTLHLASWAALLAGYHEQARALNEQVMAQAMTLGAHSVEAFGLLMKGVMQLLLGDVAAARPLLATAAEKTKVAPAWTGEALSWLAIASLECGDTTAALQHSEEAVTWVTALPQPAARVTPDWCRYRVLQAVAGNPQRAGEEAWRHLDSACRLALERIELLQDRGLRRSYLARCFPIPEIILAWAQQAGIRGISLQTLQPPPPEDGREMQPFGRLLAFATRLTAARDPQEMPVFILDEFVELSGAERAFLALNQEGASQLPAIVLTDGFAPGEADKVYDAVAPSIDQALLSRQAVLVDLPGAASQQEPATLSCRSLLVVPLVSPGGAIGVLYADTRHIFGPFRREDGDLLMVLANNAAAVLENARWTETLAQRVAQRTEQLRVANEQLAEQNAAAQRRAREMSALAEVGRDISATLDLTTVLARIAAHARELLDASDSALFLPDQDRALLRPSVALGPVAEQVMALTIRPGQGIVGDLWQRRQAEIINDTTQDPRALTIAGTVTRPGDKLLVVPLLYAENVSGMMTVWRSGGAEFTQADLRFLQGLALQGAIAIENARLYSEMEAARAAAEEANRSKSIFLANVSHELRTPLTSILGFTRIVQKRLNERIFPYVPDTDTRARRVVTQITDNTQIVLLEGERLITLINNLLDLEKIEAGRMEWHMEPLLLDEVVRHALQATASLLEQANLALAVDIPEDLPAVNGDHDKLLQVVINLVANAVKFTPTGAITCRAWRENGEVLVSISDTGRGIARQDLDAVFEKYRQVGDAFGARLPGTGLGLPICKEIVTRHSGRIWVESEPGAGSTFTFALPVPAGD